MKNHIRYLFDTATIVEETATIINYEFERESNLLIVTLKTENGETISVPAVNFQGFFTRCVPSEKKVKSFFKDKSGYCAVVIN